MRWLILALTVLSTGCSTVGYLAQATHGQLAMLNRARPIPEVVSHPRTPTHVKAYLSKIDAIKRFGKTHGLRATGSYSEYVDLRRPAAVWVVSACEELSFTPRSWSFPIVGSFTYLGWFSREGALEHAQKMRSEGLDTYVRTAATYSTLGWFPDPVLSTMIPREGEGYEWLVDTVLHESVHATVYVNGQSSFNESLASFVAGKLTPVFLGTEPAKAPGVKGAERSANFHRAYVELDGVYSAKELSVEQKRARKKEILARLKQETQLGFEPNNAFLIQYKTYGFEAPVAGGKSRDEMFAEIFRACGSDTRMFLEVLGTLSPADFPERQMEDFTPVLSPLAGACRSLAAEIDMEPPADLELRSTGRIL